ncbi:eukaryotic translation initiation factor 5A, putative [Bodo saltans]|uniref:Eukaryotic translation initiation factor 5A n=1 Tax=Bodo saltans TaxID=75058 RepID=A0A0S4IWX1_BODSA|nr:eukaryotic translation initiation factor 5A, putative [Bodo saltans]|eukprot:CUG06258.1 eukaryotic translation initiation factor 5A, putative [Bodo saltans]
MSSDEEIQVAESNSTETYPIQAGALKKGGFIAINGNACKVIDLSVSKTGKHGHAKVSITAVGIFDGRKMEDQAPSTHNVSAPFVKTEAYSVLDIDNDGQLTLMDGDGAERTGIPLPTYPEKLAAEIKEAFESGKEIQVVVTSAMGIEQVTGTKSANA